MAASSASLSPSHALYHFFVLVDRSLSQGIHSCRSKVEEAQNSDWLKTPAKPRAMLTPGADNVDDVLKEVTIVLEEPTKVEFKRLVELANYSGSSEQLSSLVKNWENNQANAIRLLREELDSLSKQRHDGVDQLKQPEVSFKSEAGQSSTSGGGGDAKDDTVLYWKQRTVHLEKLLLEASIERDQILMDKLQTQSSPPLPPLVEEELSQRSNNFLHFILQNAPVVMGHQDNELRYRFIYNHFPDLAEEDIIGKTDVEIFTGAGVKEFQNFKREVMERGMPAKREIIFETELFGSKTFLVYAEPVFSKTGDTIGVNYIGMDITDQVRKREKMAKLGEEIAVQKAKEAELMNKTIHMTGIDVADMELRDSRLV